MKELAEWVRDEAMRRGLQFADARIVESSHTSLGRQDGRTDRLSQGTSSGIGIRVLLDGAWGFASTNSLTRDDVRRCLESAIDMAKASRARVAEPGVIAAVEPVTDEVVSDFRVDPRSVAVERKMDVVRELEDVAVDRVHPHLANSIAHYSDNVTRTIVCNTLGTCVDQTQVRTSAGASITAVKGDVRQHGYEFRNGLAGFELAEELDPDQVSIKAADTALMLLDARRAPAGNFPVVLHPSIVGIFIHEALGHNAEADHVIARDSIIEGKFGEQIASELINVLDDSTIEGSWGSYEYDSEGTPGGRRVIIDNGVLTGLMHSLETAAKMGVQPNGSARAQGYSARPIVRMSNTIVERGGATLEELIKDIDLGILLEGGQWGYVLCVKGQYTCHAGWGRMIRNGQVAETIRDVTVSGTILDTLKNVTGVSREWEMAPKGGMCGKDGQGMFVNGGGPYVRVAELVVGGQERA
jgi:TldD protein